ncbi:MAG: hypothetical protein II741_07660, partial [Lachnospiraceae bacterium]|nr:hypothetical protein [Lachnospiraceae bacterium]
YDEFHTDTYENKAVEGFEDEIRAILNKRQTESGSCADWKAFGEKLSGKEIPDYNENTYQDEYITANKDEKSDTFLGKFFEGTLAQKSMVTSRIFESGNLLAGYSVDPETGKLIRQMVKGGLKR